MERRAGQLLLGLERSSEKAFGPQQEPRADSSCRISCGLVGNLALTPIDLGSMRGDYSSMSFDATRARAVLARRIERRPCAVCPPRSHVYDSLE